MCLLQNLEKLLGLTSQEMEELTTELEKFSSTSALRPKVTFEGDSDVMSPVEFLGCFECHMLRGEPHPVTDKVASSLKVQLCEGLSEVRRAKLGQYTSHRKFVSLLYLLIIHFSCCLNMKFADLMNFVVYTILNSYQLPALFATSVIQFSSK